MSANSAHSPQCMEIQHNAVMPFIRVRHCSEKKALSPVRRSSAADMFSAWKERFEPAYREECSVFLLDTKRRSGRGSLGVSRHAHHHARTSPRRVDSWCSHECWGSAFDCVPPRATTHCLLQKTCSSPNTGVRSLTSWESVSWITSSTAAAALPRSSRMAMETRRRRCDAERRIPDL